MLKLRGHFIGKVLMYLHVISQRRQERFSAQRRHKEAAGETGEHGGQPGGQGVQAGGGQEAGGGGGGG